MPNAMRWSRLGGLDHAERVAARAVGADTEPDAEFSHHFCGATALPFQVEATGL
jgi:hypothetical protein